MLGVIVLGINALYLWRKRLQRVKVNQRVRQARRQSPDSIVEEFPLGEQAVSKDVKVVDSEGVVKEEER